MKNMTKAALVSAIATFTQAQADAFSLNLKEQGTDAKKAKVTQLNIAYNSVIQSESEATENALKKAKAAKGNESFRGKMSLVYDALKSLHDAGKTINGMEVSFWKIRPDAADVGGLTLRMSTKNDNGGIDRAIFATIEKAISGQKNLGAENVTLVIRANGFTNVMA